MQARVGEQTVALYDVTLPLSTTLAGWPGDAPYRFDWTCTKAGGASVNVGQLSCSIHTGTHIDAPYHFDDAGATTERLPLTAYLGPARVVDLSGRTIIRRTDLASVNPEGTPRLLLRTASWKDHRRFPDTIPVLDEDVPAWLAERGVILIGLDVPSVDVLDSKTLPVHHALGRHGIAILESLNLSAVPEGVYELIALPLKIVGGDGSPVRAVLRTIGMT
jgi:arylformamidase